MTLHTWSWNSNRILNRPSNARKISSSDFGTTRCSRLYLFLKRNPVSDSESEHCKLVDGSPYKPSASPIGTFFFPLIGKRRHTQSSCNHGFPIWPLLSPLAPPHTLLPNFCRDTKGVKMARAFGELTHLSNLKLQSRRC